MTNETRPRILHVISTLEGGAGRGAVEMVRELQKNDDFTTRLCVLGSPQPDLPLTEVDWLTFLNCPVHFRSTTAQRFFRLRRLIQSWKPSLIHSHLWPTAMTVGLISPRRIPHLIHIRDTPPSLLSQRWANRVRRMFLTRLASRDQVLLASVSQAAADYTSDALQIEKRKITTVLNGVVLDRFLNIPALPEHRAGPLVVACAGRLVSDKGFDDVLRAIKLVGLPQSELVLRIAGTGSQFADLKQLSEALGIAEQVTFLGQVADMPQFLADAHIFVHNSNAAEGLARALMESLAAGRPVISSDHAGACEAVEDGVTGFITPVGNPSVLADTIRDISLDPERNQRMGAAARLMARNRFSIHRVVNEVTQLYSRMLTPNSTHGYSLGHKPS